MSNTSVSSGQRRSRQTGRRRKRAGRGWANKGVWILCAVAVLAAAIFLLTGKRYDPPVIQGVPEQIEVFEDDDIPAALLNSVTAVGGEDRPDQTFPVTATVYQQSGQDTQEYLPGTYRVVYRCQPDDGPAAEPVESVLTVKAADVEGPVIEGAQDITVEVDQTASYRTGVTATDNVDGPVQIQIDAGQVDLTQPGEYPVTYSATDSRGNTTTVTITVTVVEPEPEEEPDNGSQSGTETASVTQEKLDALADNILSQIITPGMSQRDQAKAIYDYVYSHVKYVGTSDKSSWVYGAYIGFTQGKGDCFNYYACSKELLTRAGIPNIDLSRVGGTTDHYWQLVNVGDGWYHFDACPHPTGFPITSFMLTEAEARAYTEYCSSVRKNYYVYDYSACPVTVVGTPETAE